MRGDRAQRGAISAGRLLFVLLLSLSAAILMRILLSPESSSFIEVSRRNAALGTFSTFIIIASEDSTEMILDSMDSLAACLDRELGVFDPEGELSRLNSSGGASLDSISVHLAEVLRISLLAAEVTDSLFDPAMGPLVDLWGFASSPSLPESASICSVLALSGIENISLGSNSIALAGGARLDLGAVAKGYTADAIYDLALSRGALAALVEIGGEIRCGGMPGTDRLWIIGVRDPRSGGTSDILEMTNGAVATSGDYESCFIDQDGTRYCHILDPRTGYPESGVASVTVRAPTAGIADALATAIAVGGVSLAEELPDSLFFSITVITVDSAGALQEWRRDG